LPSLKKGPPQKKGFSLQSKKGTRAPCNCLARKSEVNAAENILDPALVANFQATQPSAYQAASATIAKRKQVKEAASTAAMVSDPIIDQSPAEIQQQSDRSNRFGRQLNTPARFDN
jgi:hypothetical protein